MTSRQIKIVSFSSWVHVVLVFYFCFAFVLPSANLPLQLTISDIILWTMQDTLCVSVRWVGEQRDSGARVMVCGTACLHMCVPDTNSVLKNVLLCLISRPQIKRRISLDCSTLVRKYKCVLKILKNVEFEIKWHQLCTLQRPNYITSGGWFLKHYNASWFKQKEYSWDKMLIHNSSFMSFSSCKIS